jgi:Rps23 Pro-64 3,4-dihydroxylase Tpa1-like proline 4-hydroxylase
MLNLNPIKNFVETRTKKTCLINLDVSEKAVLEYNNASPFPHVFIDNFVNDIAMLDTIVEEYKNYQAWGYDPYSVKHQVKKFFSPWSKENVLEMPPVTKQLIDYLNSPTVLNKLESLTGIRGLMPDPDLKGGGMHRIDSGGKLSVHADYNKHPIKPWYRRMNLLLYLNKHWEESWGGDLQLWNKDMTAMVKSAQPIFNRAVIFNTTPTAYHGHPHTLNSPEDVSRYSIAVYYFTHDRPDHEKDNTTSATWKDIPQ